MNYSYNEAYEAKKKWEGDLLSKWDTVLNEVGVKSQHMAMQTAICLENYMDYLSSDPRLIAEDQINTGAFTGVNLALMGLIARTIPTIVGAELVGFQAMPTPKSPIFTLRWYKDAGKGINAPGVNNEMWKSPIPSGMPVGIDPFYSSQQVRDELVPVALDASTTAYALIWANRNDNLKAVKPYIYPSSLFLSLYKVSDGTLYDEYMKADAYSNGAMVQTARGAAAGGGGALVFTYTAATRSIVPGANWNMVTYVYNFSYEYKPEGDPNVPEISMKITDAYVDLIRRQLRGKYTLDSSYDIKVLHGINIDAELAEMMKIELSAEINREIVSDLRAMAAIVKTLDYNDAVSTGVTTKGNYDDATKLLADAISNVCATIWNVGRLGYGNFAVCNPETLAFLDRVGFAGFVSGGVAYTGKELSYMGTLGGKIKVYKDPNYPKGEILIGYKGPGALDAGYMHCPYLPITATPTMINQETGDPSKIFYTRYGKTFYTRGTQSDGVTDLSMPKQLILMGEWQYGRLILKNMPTIFA